MTHPSTTVTLHARWTTRPPGLRLAGTVAPGTHAVLEDYLRSLPGRFPGRRILHLMLTAVHSLDLAGIALLLDARKRLGHQHIDLRLHLPPGLRPTHGMPNGPVYCQQGDAPGLRQLPGPGNRTAPAGGPPPAGAGGPTP
ncbi:hypothetical protein C3486_29180 [Streptomyces sp. Ru73]|uniref:hypothetical protein n=1 Tax=Streptomyces sp. Ru73 TaxID=2080748 RepID=UPI000CDD8409|nr:hypothetical protein [Streptomyces sp. Ru73]POX37270.1 hypothetical protein C3486_29180 [Streptomyces sp. Ru73]